MKTARECLLRRVDGLIEPEQNGSSAQGARDAHGSGELRHLWRKVKEAQAKLKVGACTQAEHDEVVETFFAWQRKDDRCAVLMSSTDAEMIRLKHRLLQMLRAVDVYVLERGRLSNTIPKLSLERTNHRVLRTSAPRSPRARQSSPAAENRRSNSRALPQLSKNSILSSKAYFEMCKLDEDARDGTDGHGDDNGPEPGHGIRRHRIRWNCSVGHFLGRRPSW